MPRNRRRFTNDIDELLRKTHAIALRLASKRVDYDTAQDIANEVTAGVWERARKQPGFLAGPRELDRYVAIACRNGCHALARERGRRAEREAVFVEDLGDCDGCEEFGEEGRDEPKSARDQLFAALDEALALVPGPRRVAFVLVHRDDQSYDAVAKQFAVSPRTVESRVRRTKIELKAKLGALRSGGPKKAA